MSSTRYRSVMSFEPYMNASLLFCRIERNLAALTDGDAPVDSLHSFFEDERFGPLRDSYCKSRNVIIAVKPLSSNGQLNF